MSGSEDEDWSDEEVRAESDHGPPGYYGKKPRDQLRTVYKSGYASGPDEARIIRSYRRRQRRRDQYLGKKDPTSPEAEDALRPLR